MKQVQLRISELPDVHLKLKEGFIVAHLVIKYGDLCRSFSNHVNIKVLLF